MTLFRDQNSKLANGVSILVVAGLAFLGVVGCSGLRGTRNGSIEAGPYRILAIGDSITVGYTDNPTWAAPFEFGYRSELFKILKDSGERIQFMGSSVEPWNGLWKVPTNQPSPDLRTLGQDAHEGYGAKATAFVAEHIEGWVRTNQPDIILLMIGINDIRAGSTNAPDGAKSNLWKIVQTVQQTKPNTRLFVAKTIPYTRPTPAILDLNNFIGNELVPTFKARGFRVRVVDQFSNFVKEPGATAGDPSLYSNGYNHPNSQGYRLMAETWARAISQDLGQPIKSVKRQ